jgi:hypothetical protein
MFMYEDISAFELEVYSQICTITLYIYEIVCSFLEVLLAF